MYTYGLLWGVTILKGPNIIWIRIIYWTALPLLMSLAK